MRCVLPGADDIHLKNDSAPDVPLPVEILSGRNVTIAGPGKTPTVLFFVSIDMILFPEQILKTINYFCS